MIAIQMVDVDNNDGYELIEETIQSDATFRSTISIRKSKLSDFGSYNCSVWNEFGFDSKIITLVQESNFSPLVLSIGIIICGIVFIIASTIIIILCLKRKNKFVDNESYGSDLKKGQVLANNTANGKHHHNVLDSGSSGADSDIKVEVRTASSLSQQWDENDHQTNEQTVHKDIASQVVENIYSYNNNPSQPIVFPSIHNSNGFIPTYVDYSHDYLLVPSAQLPSNHNGLSPNHTQHASIIISSVDNQRASYAIEPTYGTLVGDQRYRPVGYANPYLRTSNSSSVVTTNSDNNNTNNQLSAGMYSANQRYITNNGHTGQSSQNNQLATHV
ncbi:unnamed protein product [Oppiella nova]|uniref:Uncharacterized protein n=1 Tax=Oppiella nova TaxID=334625 RepID=A0A7R9M030_9ACAR|nr:unnamed protein product [Oppiella nova]CAG2167968.1 unnamed protein product [Oppiella nova]